MIEPGSIFFIKDFDFEDGGDPSDKLLIILCVDDENSLLIKALPTSVEKVPDNKQNHGCTNNDVLSFYMFEKNRVVGKKTSGAPFSFKKNTFVLVKDNVDFLKIESLLKYYKENINHLGMLEESEFSRLLKCIKKSNHLKRKVKRELLRLIPNFN